MSDEKWTKEQVCEHIKANSENTYSMAVVVAALYAKLYGEFPTMGLSGQQAEFAEQVLKQLP